MSEWRIGNHYKIHVYEGNRPIAAFHRPEDAAIAVADHNRPFRRYGGTRSGPVLRTLADLITRQQDWTVREMMDGLAERGIAAPPKQVFNAIGYMTRKGELQRVGHGTYLCPSGPRRNPSDEHPRAALRAAGADCGAVMQDERTDEQIVAEANELARTFYRCMGYVVPEGYRFDPIDKHRHPMERTCWRMAVEAFELLQATDVEDALTNVNEDDEP